LFFYQSTAISNRAVQGQQSNVFQRFGSVVRKASTTGIEISPPLICTGGQSAKFGVVFNITQLWAARVWKCSKIPESWNEILV